MSSSESDSDDRAEVVGYQFEPGFAEGKNVNQNDGCFNFNEKVPFTGVLVRIVQYYIHSRNVVVVI